MKDGEGKNRQEQRRLRLISTESGDLCFLTGSERSIEGRRLPPRLPYNLYFFIVRISSIDLISSHLFYQPTWSTCCCGVVASLSLLFVRVALDFGVSSGPIRFQFHFKCELHTTSSLYRIGLDICDAQQRVARLTKGGGGEE